MITAEYAEKVFGLLNAHNIIHLDQRDWLVTSLQEKRFADVTCETREETFVYHLMTYDDRWCIVFAENRELHQHLYSAIDTELEKLKSEQQQRQIVTVQVTLNGQSGYLLSLRNDLDLHIGLDSISCDLCGDDVFPADSWLLVTPLDRHGRGETVRATLDTIKAWLAKQITLDSDHDLALVVTYGDTFPDLDNTLVLVPRMEQESILADLEEFGGW